MEPLLVIAGVGAVLAAAWARTVLRSGRDRLHWMLLRTLAEQRGGRVEPNPLGGNPELVLPAEGGLGPLRLRYLHLAEASATQRMWLQLELPRVLPRLSLRPEGPLSELGKLTGVQDIESGDPDLDRRFQVSADDPGLARGLLRVPVVRAVFRIFAGEPGVQVWLEVEPTDAGGSALTVLRSGWLEDHEAVRDLTEACRQVGRELVRAWDGPWLEVAQARGLAIGKLGQRSSSSLVGVVDGIPVEVRARQGAGGWRTEVTAWVDGLPGLRVVHRDLAREEGWEGQRVGLGNPVLDLCIAARALDPDALRALLEREPVMEALLPVVHGLPGSVLQHDSVRLVAPGRLTHTLGQAIDDALALARAVRAAG